ncbi:peptidoglycan bridge formation glycyltransferase FemA/FemB family protein [Massilibacteroides sp.]|uniref:lipid II:glycine glycyltransferase FemX n=1 Tax=Massilibacteroides sp. TaxID=2034766 RepID=UPI00260C4992|nr:peptidoglycan bridge formation glycyltransferase FemA/FemB family protein [Massilibacteroides sp.]MDD4515555.1 peptidoglycan bridge formation glycyltransferase FemA/FemB family protein [Massilibacteroides sp.]
MTIDVEKKEIRAVTLTPIVQQTAFWAEVKANQGIIPCAFDFKVRNDEVFVDKKKKASTNADFLILQQPLNDDYSIAYVPYGPELEPSEELQGEFLEELSETVRSFLPKNCIGVRYDLAWQSHWDTAEYYDENNLWVGPPEKKYQEFRLNYNTSNWNLRRANSDILPSNTIYIDLTAGEKTILARMKPKTRYNILLSYRRGVTVRQAGMDELHIWYELYKETAQRNRLFLNDIEYFKTVLNAKAEDSLSPATVELLMAEKNGEPLAAIFLIISGNRGTYLYGASSSKHRNCMPTYALQWEAIQRAKARGCLQYDMFGVSPGPDSSHPMYGLYKFKSGFGGELYHQMGCWDYPFDDDSYKLFIAAEMHSQGYHL